MRDLCDLITYLGLGVGAEVAEGAVAAELSQLGVELVCKQACEGHGLRGLISGIAEHDALT